MNTLLLKSTTQDIEKAALIIKDGGLVCMPTETVYGLAANALDGKAVAEIFKAKGRPMDNPLIVHISDIEQITRFNLVSELPQKAKILAEKFWPGPLTIIMKKGSCIPNEVSAGLDTVAIRYPSHKVAQQLISMSDTPLAAPSANLSGSPSPTTAQHCIDDMMGKVGAIIDGGICDVGVESTVITLATDIPTVLRPGGITVEQIRSVIGKVNVDKAVVNGVDKDAVVASPGMKYKHYSPKAEVTLVGGDKFSSYVNFCSDISTAVICYDEDIDSINKKIEIYDLGGKTDFNTHAHRIFEILREIDKNDKIKKVYAPLPSKEGVSLAVYNRMIRAAGFKIVNTPSSFVLGLTGPTGAGKSLADKVFSQYGYHIIDTDRIAKKSLQKGSTLIPSIVMAFGKGVVDSNGEIIRQNLADIAFSSKENTQKLNSITHPYIYQQSFLEIEEYEKKGFNKFVIDAPVLFESKGEMLCDKVLSVYACDNIRKERIINRDKLSDTEAKKRMDSQHSMDYYKSRSDYFVENDGEVADFEKKLHSICEVIDGNTK